MMDCGVEDDISGRFEREAISSGEVDAAARNVLYFGIPYCVFLPSLNRDRVTSEIPERAMVDRHVVDGRPVHDGQIDFEDQMIDGRAFAAGNETEAHDQA